MNTIATVFRYKIIYKGVEVRYIDYDLLQAFGAAFPALSLEEWQAFTEEQARERAQALVDTIIKCDTFYFENELFKKQEDYMVGMVIDFCGNNSDPRWMEADGSMLKKADYPELFEVIGYNFGGEGDRFALPNLCGRSSIGFDKTAPTSPTHTVGLERNYGKVGNIGGQIYVELTTQELPPHSHPYPLPVFEQRKWGDNANTRPFPTSWVNSKTGTEGQGKAFGIRSPYIVLKKLIKVKKQ